MRLRMLSPRQSIEKGSVSSLRSAWENRGGPVKNVSIQGQTVLSSDAQSIRLTDVAQALDANPNQSETETICSKNDTSTEVFTTAAQSIGSSDVSSALHVPRRLSPRKSMENGHVGSLRSAWEGFTSPNKQRVLPSAAHSIGSNALDANPNQSETETIFSKNDTSTEVLTTAAQSIGSPDVSSALHVPRRLSPRQSIENGHVGSLRSAWEGFTSPNKQRVLPSDAQSIRLPDVAQALDANQSETETICSKNDTSTEVLTTTAQSIDSSDVSSALYVPRRLSPRKSIENGRVGSLRSAWEGFTSPNKQRVLPSAAHSIGLNAPDVNQSETETICSKNDTSTKVFIPTSSNASSFNAASFYTGSPRRQTIIPSAAQSIGSHNAPDVYHSEAEMISSRSESDEFTTSFSYASSSSSSSCVANKTLGHKGIAFRIFLGVATAVAVSILCSVLALLFSPSDRTKPSDKQIFITETTLFPSSLHPTISAMPVSAAPSPKPSMSPSVIPSNTPSIMPTNAPSTLPSEQPSTSPTLSGYPSSKPSLQPTITSSPSSEPSQSPTMSQSPSSAPSAQPTISTQPTSKPSLRPSISAMPSTIPSFSPTLNPTLSPTWNPSAAPSTAPSKSKPISTSIVLEPSESNSKNLVAVGAICLFLVVSTLVYVSKNSKRSKGGGRSELERNPSFNDLEKMHRAASLSNFGNQNCSTNRQDDYDDNDMENIDFGDGRVMKADDSVADSSLDSSSVQNVLDLKGIYSISKIMFNRTSHKKQAMSWMEVRDGGSSASSSGRIPTPSLAAPSLADSSIASDNLPGVVELKNLSTMSKIFQKTPQKQCLSWMEVRDGGSSASSSGRLPAPSLAAPSFADSSIASDNLPVVVELKNVSTMSKIFQKTPQKQCLSWMEIRDDY